MLMNLKAKQHEKLHHTQIYIDIFITKNYMRIKEILSDRTEGKR